MFGMYDLMSVPALGGAFVLVAALVIIFWLWMFIDCVQRQDNKFPAKGKNDKVVWAVTLLWLTILGALLYYVLVKSRTK